MIWVGVIIVIVAIVLGAFGLIAGTAYSALLWIGGILLVVGLVLLALNYTRGRRPLP